MSKIWGVQFFKEDHNINMYSLIANHGPGMCLKHKESYTKTQGPGQDLGTLSPKLANEKTLGIIIFAMLEI